MKFIKNYGGRENYFSTQFKKDNTNDCVIRAISIATEQDYKKVWNELFELACKTGFMPNDKKCFDTYLESLGWTKKSPLKYGNKKYKVKNVGQFFKGKNVIIHTTNHLTTLVDGDLNDIWDCREWCANSYYVKEKVEITGGLGYKTTKKI